MKQQIKQTFEFFLNKFGNIKNPSYLCIMKLRIVKYNHQIDRKENKPEFVIEKKTQHMEYAVINKTETQQKIQELEDKLQHKSDENNIWYLKGMIDTLKITLEIAKPLTPEIEKAFDAGRDFEGDEDDDDEIPDCETYISNLEI